MGEYGVDDLFFKGLLYNVVKDVRGVGEGDWGKLLSHLLREMWIEICRLSYSLMLQSESSPAGDVD